MFKENSIENSWMPFICIFVDIFSLCSRLYNSKCNLYLMFKFIEQRRELSHDANIINWIALNFFIYDVFGGNHLYNYWIMPNDNVYWQSIICWFVGVNEGLDGVEYHPFMTFALKFSFCSCFFQCPFTFCLPWPSFCH